MDNLGKKVIKNIVFCSVDDVKGDKVPLPIIVDGEDLINMPSKAALKILDEHGLINEHNNVIIPVGMKLTGKQSYGQSTEYTFDQGYLVVDLTLTNEDEYFK